MAILRHSIYEKTNEVRILDIEKGKVLYKFLQPENIHKLIWAENNKLIVLSDTLLYTIAYDGESEPHIIERNHRYRDIILSQDGSLIALQKSSSKRSFFEQSLPFTAWENKQIFNFEDNINSLSYSAKARINIIKSSDNRSTIFELLDSTQNVTEQLLQTELGAHHIESSIIGDLFVINNQLVFLERQSLNLTYITSEDDFLGDAAFNEDKTQILFTMKNYPDWVAFKYDIVKREKTQLFTNVRFIREMNSSYIIGRDKGELYIVNNQSRSFEKLDFHLSTEPNTRWYAKGNRIYWSKHDALSTEFYELTIQDNSNPKVNNTTFSYNNVSPIFFIDTDGASLIYSFKENNSTDIVRIDMTKV